MSDAPIIARSLADGGYLDVIINVPKGNVLTRAVMDQLDRALAEHAEAPQLKLVTIRGEGKHFSFGASVEEHRPDTAKAMLASFHALVRRVGRYPVPIVAAVDGRCLGGAFELALACHMVVATSSAVFACPEIRLGVIPPVLAAIGAARLGVATTERLLLTGAELDARRAHAIGFVAELIEDSVRLEPWLRAWYHETFAPISAYALRQGVAAVRRGTGLLAMLDGPLADAERQYLTHVLPSHDGCEGIEAFLAKRSPVWRNA